MNVNTVTAEVICPASSGTYDFIIDCRLKISELINIFTEQIRIYEKNKLLFSGKYNPRLYCSELRLPLDPEMTLEEYGVRNGCRLMII